MLIPKVYLPMNKNSIRAHAGLQGFPLSEKPDFEVKTRDDTYSLLDWLDVENSPRYQPTKKATHCDAYAGDYCQIRNIYLPSGIFWNKTVLWNAEQAEKMHEKYEWPKIILGYSSKGGTVEEYSANSVFDWLRKYGNYFGWEAIDKLSYLQKMANENYICIISGKNKIPGKSGHIVIVIPEYPEKGIRAKRQYGEVIFPVTRRYYLKYIFLIKINQKYLIFLVY
jgi:hypothetical protein